MAGQSRTLKLSILADVDQLKKSLNTGSTEVQGFGDKIGNFSKKAGLAFAAAGAAAAAYAGTKQTGVGRTRSTWSLRPRSTPRHQSHRDQPW